MQLQNDVSILQKRPTIPIVAQPPAPIPIRNHTVSMLHLRQRRPHVPDLILMRLHPSPERSLGLVMVVVMRVGFQPKHCCLCQQHPLHLRRLDRQRGQVTRRRTVAGVAEVAQGRHGSTCLWGPFVATRSCNVCWCWIKCFGFYIRKRCIVSRTYLW